MRRNRVLRAAALASVVTLFLAACTAGSGGTDATGDGGGDGGGSVTLRYAFFAPIQTFPGVQMEEWAKRLQEKTETDVEVQMFAGGTLLGAGDIFSGVAEGVADVGMDSPAYDIERFPLASVINLQLGYQCAQAASMAFLDLLLEYKPQGFEGFKIVTAFTTEPAHIQSKTAVDEISDLQGMELRTSGALTPLLESFGAAPVGLPMPEVAQALETGVINGYVSSREVMKDFGLATQVNYWTDYAFGVSNTFVAVMDKERFERLPEDVQKAINDLRTDMARFASEYHDEENVGAALKFAKKKGVEKVELAEGQKPKWDAKLEQQIDRWLKKVQGNGFDPQEVLNRAKELVDKYSGLCKQG